MLMAEIILQNRNVVLFQGLPVFGTNVHRNGLSHDRSVDPSRHPNKIKRLFLFSLLLATWDNPSPASFVPPLDFAHRHADWLLGCETPAGQISPHCPDRKPNTESLLN